MATPFPFVSGAVLQASQLNAITELPTRTLTASGAAVAADSYSRVVLNGTSITYTVNTSTFTAGQVVELYNANSTAATIAAGAGVTLNGASGLTIAQYQTAQLYAVSATSFILSKSDVTVSSGGLVYLTQATFTTVSSVSMPASTFTSTYDHYKVFVRLTAASNTNAFGIRVNNAGSARTAANYYYGGNNVTNGASSSSIAGTGATSVVAGYTNTAIFGSWSIDVHDPLNTSTYTGLTVNYIGSDSGGNSGGGYTGGFYYVTEANDVLTFVVANTMSGTYWVYGYKDS